MNEIEEKKLKEEGRVLLSYVSGVKPDQKLISRYIDAIIKINNGKSLDIPKIISLMPTLLVFLEKNIFFNKKTSELDRRLLIALALSEASTENINKFILNKESNIIISYVYITIVILIDILIKIIQPFLKFVLFFFLNKKFKSYLQ